MKNEIIVFEDEGIRLDVNLSEETVWLTQAQMAELFERDRKTITRHIRNIYKSKELEEMATSSKNELVQKEGNRNITRQLIHYNLDMIISVGYRVNSKRGVEFRQWATNVLKKYIVEGYAVNPQRLDYLEKTVKLIEIANRNELEDNEAKNILVTIGNYSKALDLLDQYDYQSVKKPKGSTNDKQITYQECIDVISQLKFNENSTLFALERKHGLESIINNLYQTFNDKDIYPTIEEKAANFLYLVVKNHVFIDGNKRIGAALFIYFLQFYNILKKDNQNVIDNNTLVALTLLIANSDPKEKQIMVDLIMNFLV